MSANIVLSLFVLVIAAAVWAFPEPIQLIVYRAYTCFEEECKLILTFKSREPCVQLASGLNKTFDRLTLCVGSDE